MKRSLVLVLALVFGASVLSAQMKFGVAGGVTLPQSDFKDAANTGWEGMGLIQFATGPVDIRVDATYGMNAFSDALKSIVGSGNFKLFGGNADVVYNFKMEGTIKPYVLGGVGYYNIGSDVSGSTSESKFAWNAGAGINFNMLFVEARYLSVATSGSATTFIPIDIGLKFGGK